MKYLNPSSFSEPVGGSKVTDRQYDIALGRKRDERVKQIDNSPKRRRNDEKTS